MWSYNNGVLPDTIIENYQGFVYQITNLETGRKYIGKKNFWASKTVTRKGKKKRLKVESDWKEYYGSSNELLEDIKTLGKDRFQREVLELCPSKGILGYMELRYQIDLRVLEKPTEYYNSFAGGKFHRAHIKPIIDLTFQPKPTIL